MKNLKKLASLLLVLTMVLCMATTAFAAGTGSITVANAEEGATYTAYKIFDVVYNNDKSACSYTIESDSVWYSTVNTYTGVSLEQVGDTTTYNVVKQDSFSAAEFAATLSEALKNKNATGASLTVSGGQATATGLDFGYYFVTTSTGALCNLVTADTVTIHDKNVNPFDKVANDTSVEVGQKVTFTITGQVPATTGFDSYTYTVKDTMSNGLTFNKDVKVYVDGTELSSNFTVDYDSTTNDFVLTIDVMKLQTNIGDKIEVTYSAIVNEYAVSVISKNNATLTYSNDPTDGTKTTETPAEEVDLYSAKIVIDKYDSANEETKLAGAEFVLYKHGEGDSKMYYKYDEDTNTVSWVTTEAEATKVTTNGKGVANFIGLEDGTYYLHETKAPTGYNRLKEDKEIVIKGTNNEGDIVEANLTATSKVANNTGSELPETGGMGTTLFYALGGALVLAAVVLLVTKKRMSAIK